MKISVLRKATAFAAAAVIALSGCTAKGKQAQNAETDAPAPKALVCYFSATGTTRAQAERLAEIAGADIYEIAPKTPYTDADLNWRDSLSRSTVEMHDRAFRPELADSAANVADYEIVYIGYPNWWHTAPTIINTFIETYNLEGKTLVPFMTSGGGDITNSEKDLKEAYPTLKWAKGLLMNDVTDEEIAEWVKTTAK